MRWKNYGKLLGNEMEKLWELGEMRWKMIGSHGNVLEDFRNFEGKAIGMSWKIRN